MSEFEDLVEAIDKNDKNQFEMDQINLENDKRLFFNLARLVKSLRIIFELMSFG